MAPRKAKPTKPYAVTLAPFVGMTEVKIVRTADGHVVHCGLHLGGTDRALRIANALLDEETGIDTSAADRLTDKPVSLRKPRLDYTRRLVTRLHP
jgi:8-oxo-dGTP pyrophosphatase MutT (NUDIX family)